METLLENISRKLTNNCIVVLKNAPYYSTKIENWKIFQLYRQGNMMFKTGCCFRKSIQFEETFLKVELLVIVNEHRRNS